MGILFILILILGGSLVGFTAGRLGDKWGGHLNVPHHWIYGVLSFNVGLFLLSSWAGVLLPSFGVGHFISDLDDFLHMRVIGVDEPHEWKFWSIR